MTVAAFAIWASLAGMQADQVPNWVHERTVGKRTIRLELKREQGPFAGLPVLENHGLKVAMRSNGTFTPAFRVDGGVAEWEKGQSLLAANPNAPIWRAKFFVVTRVDSLVENGILRPVRGNLMTAQQEEIDREIALWACRTEAAMGGAMKVELSIDYDHDEVFTGPTPFANEELREYVRPRINREKFDAPDNIDRGPWDMAVVIHAGLTGTGNQIQLHGTPVFALSYRQDHVLGGPHGLSRALMGCWKDALMAGNMLSHGLWPVETTGRVRSAFDESAVAVPQWVDQNRPSTAVWTRRDPPVLYSAWHQIADGYMAKLPWLDRTLFRCTISSRPSPHFPYGDGILDDHFEPDVESCLTALFGETKVLLVPCSIVGVVAPHFRDDINAKPIALTDVGGTPFVVFETADLSGRKTEFSLLRSSFRNTGSTISVPALEGRADVPPHWGTAAVSPNKDQPGTIEVAFRGGSRVGGINLWKRKDGTHFSVENHIDVTLDADFLNPEPAQITVVYRNNVGWQTARVGLFGLSETTASADAPSTFTKWTPPTGGKGTIRVPLNGPAQIDQVWLETPPATSVHSPLDFKEVDWKIRAASISANSPEPKLSEPTSGAPEDAANHEFVTKAKQAYNSQDIVGARAHLLDRNELIRLNAARVFTKLKDPLAEATLIEQSQRLSTRVAEQAILALRFQGTQSAFAGIKRTMEIGPSDMNRQFAVRALHGQGDHAMAGSMSALYGARSWRTRRAAVDGIGSIPGSEAAKLLIVFFQEVDPAVRLKVVEKAKMDEDVVCRRVLWYSVNDPSEAVRAACYVRLTESPLPQFVAEGLKGVRDESWAVRSEVTLQLGRQAKESNRQALRIAVVDQHPAVRAQALLGFALIPGEVSSDEIANVLNDEHPLVKAALAALRKAKTIKSGTFRPTW